MASCDFSSKRPTLPPLHTLDLPFPLTSKPRLQGFHATHHNVCFASLKYRLLPTDDLKIYTFDSHAIVQSSALLSAGIMLPAKFRGRPRAHRRPRHLMVFMPSPSFPFHPRRFLRHFVSCHAKWKMLPRLSLYPFPHRLRHFRRVISLAPYYSQAVR